LSQKRHFFAEKFGENIFKIITSVPEEKITTSVYQIGPVVKKWKQNFAVGCLALHCRHTLKKMSSKVCYIGLVSTNESQSLSRP
jgi:hypothetical protein